MQPDYAAMSFKELRAYVLKHHEDQEAFYALADRIRSRPSKSYTIADIDRLPEILRESGKLPKQPEE